jgi:hypothetical protein
MDFSSPVADTTSLYIQEGGALLFGLVFLFLWRQSRVVYFGLWSVAWALRCGWRLVRFSNSASWLYWWPRRARDSDRTLRIGGRRCG